LEELYEIIDSNRNQYKDFINQALTYKDEIWQIQDQSKEKDSTKPTWNNGFLPGLDILMIYTFIAELKPKRYIEIGSGNSTKVVNKAKTEKTTNTEIISILIPCLVQRLII